MESTTIRFDGAVHHEVNADIGTNRHGERVVRLDLTYTQATPPSQTTTIITLDAAIALRNQLDGLFDAAGIDDGDDGGNDDDLVNAADGCPNCGERRSDMLIWMNDEHDSPLRCMTCGKRYAI
jgi:hypothetical protein